MREKKRREASGFGFTEIQLNESEHAAECVQVHHGGRERWKGGV